MTMKLILYSFLLILFVTSSLSLDTGKSDSLLRDLLRELQQDYENRLEYQQRGTNSNDDSGNNSNGQPIPIEIEETGDPLHPGNSGRETLTEEDAERIERAELMEELEKKYGEDNQLLQVLNRVFDKEDNETLDVEDRGSCAAANNPETMKMNYYTVINGKYKPWSRLMKSLCLTAHNRKRGCHSGTPQLEWDKDLACKAQLYAEKLARSTNLVHDPNRGNDGENLFRGSNTLTDGIYGPEFAVATWYGEMKNFNYKDPGYSHDTGHLTQVLWKKSTRVGCGLATSTRTEGPFTYTTTVVVARYLQAGNTGNFDEMVKNFKAKCDEEEVVEAPVNELLPGTPSCLDISVDCETTTYCHVENMPHICSCSCP